MRSSSTKCVILSSLTVGPCSAANGNSIAARYREARSPPLKADVHGLKELVNYGLHELGHLYVQYLRSCFASGSRRPEQASTLISGWRRHVLLARSCGADLKDHQSVFRTLWRVHRSWPSSSEHQRLMKSRWVWRRQLGFTTLPNFPFWHSVHFIVYCVRLKPASFGGATWKLLMNSCQHVTKTSLCHRQHQTSQSVQSGRSRSSSTRAFGMSWNLPANKYHEGLNS